MTRNSYGLGFWIHWGGENFAEEALKRIFEGAETAHPDINQG